MSAGAASVVVVVVADMPPLPEQRNSNKSNNNGIVLSVCCDQLMLQQRPMIMKSSSSSSSLSPSALPLPSPPSMDDDKQMAIRLPPMFILLISLLEISYFIYYNADGDVNGELTDRSSWLIYRPDRRLQLWRFLSYALLHANWLHLGFNVITQLIYGVPLEIIHGSWRIAGIYLAGVLAGALGTSIVDSTVYLVGASGGVYALLAAQLSNVLLNYSHIKYSLAQLVSVGVFVSCDAGYALYSRQLSMESCLPTVSYIAHMTGALAGFTVGLLLLRNFGDNLRSRLLRLLALGVWMAFVAFAITFNLINTMTVQLLAEEEGEVLKQHLLHDLGIS